VVRKRGRKGSGKFFRANISFLLMQAQLRPQVDAAAALLRRSRGGPDGVVAAASAVEGVRRALQEASQASALALRPTLPDLDAPALLALTTLGATTPATPLLATLAGSSGAAGAASSAGAQQAPPSATTAMTTTAAVAAASGATAAVNVPANLRVEQTLREAAGEYDRAAAAFLARIDGGKG
jgi:hypothetical protein